MEEWTEMMKLAQKKQDIEILKKAYQSLKEENQKLSEEWELLIATQKKMPKIFFRQKLLAKRGDEANV